MGEEIRSGSTPGLLPLTAAQVYAALACVSGVLFGWSASIGDAPRLASVTWVGFVVSLGTAIFIWRARRWAPEFRTVAETRSGQGKRWQVVGWVTVGGMLGVVVAALASVMPMPGVLASALVPLLYLGVVFARDRAAASTARRLLRAPPLPPELPDEQFGAVEGRLEGELEMTRTHGAQSESHTVSRTDSQGRSFDATESHVTVHWSESWKAGRVGVRTEVAPVELEPSGALFGAAARIEYPTRVSPGLEHLLSHMTDHRLREKMRAAELGGSPRLVARARTGDSVLVVGRIRRSQGGAAMAATGPGSLVLFAAPGSRSARATLRRHLLHHDLGLLGLLLLALTSVGVALAHFDGAFFVGW